MDVLLTLYATRAWVAIDVRLPRVAMSHDDQALVVPNDSNRQDGHPATQLAKMLSKVPLWNAELRQAHWGPGNPGSHHSRRRGRSATKT